MSDFFRDGFFLILWGIAFFGAFGIALLLAWFGLLEVIGAFMERLPKDENEGKRRAEREGRRWYAKSE